ncbi:MAG: ACP S-malonyltransferase [Gloeomargaritaceae cyanobacterium C42_A2020_066]|nr:ACP S-malonyltransferase [Gloeomargaritaceae cyanobacterium C42_A2020_066]
MGVAWVFPGQGSQSPGMGLDLATHPLGQRRYAEAAEVLGWSVVDICTPPATDLNQTRHTQPCLYVVAAILADLLRERGQAPDGVAGHSLGEYTALYVAGVFDFATGLDLVNQRAKLMEMCGEGRMVALVGFDRPAVEAAVAAIPDVVLANDNHPDQVVVSGTSQAVETLLGQVKVKRAVPLAVSGAFHSPLVVPAAAAFAQVLERVPFREAQVPVWSNVEPTPTQSAEHLKARLGQQMTTGVRWRETVLALAAAGLDTVVEVGPGKVLTGLVKRTAPDLKLVNIGQLADLP